MIACEKNMCKLVSILLCIDNIDAEAVDFCNSNALHYCLPQPSSSSSSSPSLSSSSELKDKSKQYEIMRMLIKQTNLNLFSPNDMGEVPFDSIEDRGERERLQLAMKFKGKCKGKKKYLFIIFKPFLHLFLRLFLHLFPPFFLLFIFVGTCIFPFKTSSVLPSCFSFPPMAPLPMTPLPPSPPPPMAPLHTLSTSTNIFAPPPPLPPSTSATFSGFGVPVQNASPSSLITSPSSQAMRVPSPSHCFSSSPIPWGTAPPPLPFPTPPPPAAQKIGFGFGANTIASITTPASSSPSTPSLDSSFPVGVRV